MKIVVEVVWIWMVDMWIFDDEYADLLLRGFMLCFNRFSNTRVIFSTDVLLCPSMTAIITFLSSRSCTQFVKEKA
jgi:hypothetical protein